MYYQKYFDYKLVLGRFNKTYILSSKITYDEKCGGCNTMQIPSDTILMMLVWFCNVCNEMGPIIMLCDGVSKGGILQHIAIRCIAHSQSFVSFNL